MSIQGLYNDPQRPWAAIIDEMKILMPLRNNSLIFLKFFAWISFSKYISKTHHVFRVNDFM